MAGRYSGWIGKKGGAENPVAVQVGRKLLGMLAIRRKVPGVKTLPERVVLEDGTIVEARFDGDIPRVLVIPPEDVLELVQCELYVESGMLDLGPNIADDAASRWDRGLPEFDDSPATLHFGSGVDCPEGVLGLNGRVVVSNRGRIRSGCLPSKGPAVQSRLRSPAKKQAQAVLPASTWSGLMHRYVAAVYGGQQCDYEISGASLVVRLADDAVVIDPAAGWGLVENNGAHAFCTTNAVDVTLYGLRFTKCAAKVYEAWRLLRDAGETAPEQLDKLLTIALSGCIPGDFIDSISRDRAGKLFSESGEQANGYGYAYAKNRAMSVLYRDSNESGLAERIRETLVEEVVFSYDYSGGWSITSNLIVDYKVLSQHGASVNGFSAQSEAEAFDIVQYAAPGLDAPIYCYYVGEQRKIFWVSTVVQEEPDIPAWDTLSCYYPTPSNHVDGDTSSQNIDCSIITTRSKTYFSGLNIAHGMYSTLDSVVDWSDVETSKAFKEHRHAGPVMLRLFAKGLLRAIAREPFLTATFDDNNDPRPDHGPPYDPLHGGPDCSKTHIVVGASDADVGEGVRPDCTIRVFGLISPPEYPNPTGSALHQAYTDLTSNHSAFDTLAVLGEFGWRRSMNLVLPRGHRGAAGYVAYKSAGMTGLIGRSHDWYSMHFARTITWANSETGETVIVYDVNADCAEKRAGVNQIWPTQLVTPGTQSVFSVKISGFRSYAEAYASYGGTHVDFTTRSRAESSVIDSSTSHSFRSRMHIGADVVYSEDASGTSLSDPDFDWLGSPGEFGSIDCLDMLGDIIERQTVDDPLALDMPYGERQIESLSYASSGDVYASRWYTVDNTARYVARASLLGAMTIPRAGAVRGESINMDREDIAGGYPKVSTPSFVGWA